MSEYILLGNGASAGLYHEVETNGKIYTCNLPPFAVPEAVATFMVDFKMMRAIASGSVVVPGDWIIGARPKYWMNKNPTFYMKYSGQIKEMFIEKPDYAPDYTAFNCGHMGAYYLLKRKQAKVIHLFGFDSIFSFDLHSVTDFYLNSDRSTTNSRRLADNWRPIWQKIFEEFSDVQFKVYYYKEVPKISLPSNVKVIIRNNKKK